MLIATPLWARKESGVPLPCAVKEKQVGVIAQPLLPFPCDKEDIHISPNQVIETVVSLEEERKVGEEKARDKAARKNLGGRAPWWQWEWPWGDCFEVILSGKSHIFVWTK